MIDNEQYYRISNDTLIRVASCVEGGASAAMSNDNAFLNQFFQRIFNGSLSDGRTKLHYLAFCKLTDFISDSPANHFRRA